MTITAQTTVKTLLVVAPVTGLDDREHCELCGATAEYLYLRTTAVTIGDHDADEEIRVCEPCADHADVSPITD